MEDNVSTRPCIPLFTVRDISTYSFEWVNESIIIVVDTFLKGFSWVKKEIYSLLVCPWNGISPSSCYTCFTLSLSSIHISMLMLNSISHVLFLHQLSRVYIRTFFSHVREDFREMCEIFCKAQFFLFCIVFLANKFL